jgi:beta-lactamase class D
MNNKYMILINLILLNIIFLHFDLQSQTIDSTLNQFFARNQVSGIILISNLDNSFSISNTKNIDKRFLPASTFKIPNTIISLETGVIKDENEKFKWDGEKRWIENWNQDTDLKMGMKNSTVWFYQELARRIGSEKMQNYLNQFNYGNKNIGGGIDRFWLDGDLKISPTEQVDFHKKVYSNKLKGISERSLEITKMIMLRDSTEKYKIRAKTGWAIREDYVGWFVGWVETKDNVYFFATCIQPYKDKENLKNLISDEIFTKARIEITYDILKKLKIIE